jgi:hypothetical protein
MYHNYYIINNNSCVTQLCYFRYLHLTLILSSSFNYFLRPLNNLRVVVYVFFQYTSKTKKNSYYFYRNTINSVRHDGVRISVRGYRMTLRRSYCGFRETDQKRSIQLYYN